MASDSPTSTTPEEQPERLLAADIPVRPAATVILVRDGDEGPEVFMLRRTLSAAFAGGQ